MFTKKSTSFTYSLNLILLLLMIPIIETMASDIRYKVAACDWMMLKRQKIGEFQLISELGGDGIEMDMGALGKRDSFDNKLRDKHFQVLFKETAAKYKVEVKSETEGYVKKIDAYKIAYGCKLLGAGREKKTDSIDYSVGVYLNKKTGEKVNIGDTLYTIYSNDEMKTEDCKKYCNEAYEFVSEEPAVQKQIYTIIK